jgi:uncharacterized membrane protein
MTRRPTSLSAIWLATFAWSRCGRLGPLLGLGRGLDQLVIGAILLSMDIAALMVVRRSESADRWLRPRNSPRRQLQSILAERNACGEIGREEFLEKSRDLQEKAR